MSETSKKSVQNPIWKPAFKRHRHSIFTLKNLLKRGDFTIIALNKKCFFHTFVGSHAVVIGICRCMQWPRRHYWASDGLSMKKLGSRCSRLAHTWLLIIGSELVDTSRWTTCWPSLWPMQTEPDHRSERGRRCTQSSSQGGPTCHLRASPTSSRDSM